MAADRETWQTVGKLVGALLAVGILAAGILLPYVGGLGLVAGNAAGKFLDTPCQYEPSTPPQKTTMYARDGKTVIATLFSQDRVPVPLSQVPEVLQEALVATEDRRFYQHHGVDLRGLIRSAISTSGGDTQGGSTLTMQYVKQVRYYQAGDDKKKQEAAIAVNLHRKMEDAKCAIYIERTLHESKKQILEDYLNIAFFGEHSYGIQTAAETYFNKPASKLSLEESALLVGLLRAPSAYDPFVNPAAAKERRDEVLQNLVSVGQLSQAAADRSKTKPIALATQSPPQVREGCANASSTISNAAFFCEYVVDWLADHPDVNTGEVLDRTHLETGGYKIVTTLDPHLQNSAQRRITKYVPAKAPMTAALPVLDPRTGEILAMATSKTYGTGRGQTEQPVFTKLTAHGASTFKLFPLLAALSTGIPSDWKLTTVGNTGSYKPKNCGDLGKHYKGVVNGDANVLYNQTESLSTATAKSSNTFFVGLTDELFNCRLQPIVDLMSKLGMKSMQAHDPNDNPKLTYAQNMVANSRDQQLVLGSIPTSPLELAGAYAAVANGGEYNEPTPVLGIVDNAGKAIDVKRTPAVQAIAPQVAAQAAEILTGDTESFGTSASVFDNWYGQNSSIIAGKTGTNGSIKKDKNASVWFVGMTPDLVGAAGIINFDNTSIPSKGLVGEGVGEAYGDFAAKVWIKALQPTLEHRSWEWPDPDTVGSTEVPDIGGMSLSDARHTLADYGLKLARIDSDNESFYCPSSEPFDTIGYYGPQRADSGDTITVCISSGVPQTVIIPKPPKKTHPSGSASATPTAGSSSSSSPGNGNGGGGGPPGHR